MKDSGSGRIVFREGKRIYLRPPLTEDMRLLVKWFNDYRITRFLNCRLPTTEAEERAWIDDLHKHSEQQVPLVIVLKGRKPGLDYPIGTIQLHQIDRESGTALKGTAIGETDYWNRGYGTEASMLLLDFAFNTLNLRKIYSHVLSTNERNIGLNDKCGFTHEATLPKHYFHEGVYVDELIFAVYADTWRMLWQKTRSHFVPSVPREHKGGGRGKDHLDSQ